MSHSKWQRLSPIEEEYICDWVNEEEDSGRAPSKLEIRIFAECILETSEDHTTLGKKWVDYFLTHHPQIKMKLGRGLEAARTTACTPEALRRFP